MNKHGELYGEYIIITTKKLKGGYRMACGGKKKKDKKVKK